MLSQCKQEKNYQVPTAVADNSEDFFHTTQKQVQQDKNVTPEHKYLDRNSSYRIMRFRYSYLIMEHL
jgi:hypothetical protein